MNDAAIGKDLLLDKVSKKLRALKKEEKLEKRLNMRLQQLYVEAKRLMAEEPSIKGKVEELLLEIDQNNKDLLALMAKKGEFEKVLDRRVDAGFTKERKQQQLLAILDQAIKYDENLLAATRRLGKLLK